MHSKTFILVLYPIFTGISCNDNINPFQSDKAPVEKVVVQKLAENPYAFIHEIPLPAGYARIPQNDASFAGWLLNIPLKKSKTVYTFDGRRKANQSAQFAVLDITVGNKNLQQCADAVMRLRAEYFYENTNYDQISFTDNEGTKYLFKPPYNRSNFLLYLDRVFGMCGSASLSKQLKKKPLNLIEPGDVLIRGGFPGHAVMVMDVAENKAGKKMYLLAQSYMPAQDIHVLLNPANENVSPWYEVNNKEIIETPEYTFTKGELKGW